MNQPTSLASDTPLDTVGVRPLDDATPRADEMLGTAILALVVFAVTDPTNRGGPTGRFAPIFIGLTVAGLISFIAPLTQACFNPARDFGPRLFAYLAGWGSVAMPGERGMATLCVYLAAPILGAVLGAGAYQAFSKAM